MPVWARHSKASTKNLMSLEPIRHCCHWRCLRFGKPKGKSPDRSGGGPPSINRVAVKVSHGGPPPIPHTCPVAIWCIQNWKAPWLSTFFPPNTGIGKNMLLSAMLVSCRILGGVKHILFSSIFLAPRDAKNPEGPCFFRPSDTATESPIASYERIGVSSGVSSPGCQPQCLLVHQQEGNQAVEAIAYGLPNTALDRPRNSYG